MKLKTLIEELLREAEWNTDIECCVGNVDIHYVSNEPAYYDGSLQVLERDETNTKGYNIIGGKYVHTGRKLQINILPISDILRDEKAFIDYTNLGSEALKKSYKDSDDKTREVFKEIYLDSEWRLFREWAKEKAIEISGDPISFNKNENLYDFFVKNINPEAPLPITNSSPMTYSTQRKMQWDNMIEITYEGLEFALKLK